MDKALSESIYSILAAGPTRDVEEFVTELARVPEGWWGVLAAGAVIAGLWGVIWMYRNEGRIGSSASVRLILATIRCVGLLTLVLILLEPISVRILHRWVDSYTILLLDNSSSMGLTDSYRVEENAERLRKAIGDSDPEPPTRGEIVNHLLTADDRKILRDLAGRNRVKVYGFDHEPRLLGTIRAAHEKQPTDKDADKPNANDESALMSAASVSLQLSATGTATNVERAVRRTLEAVGSAPVAGIVVLSDGGFNEGATAEDTARLARELNVPIHVVGIGDPSSTRNVRVIDVLAPDNAFKQDPFAVTARLSATGFDGATIVVQLRERNATLGGEGSIVDSKTALVPPGGAIEPIVFRRSQEEVGRFTYLINVPALESETVIDDNSKQITVNVIDSRTRVLLVSGGPSWDYRFLSRLLQRDESVDLSCWLQSADLSAVRDGNTVIDHLPALREELFEYDVVILMDPEPSEFDAPWCQLVDTLVTEYGGGLLLTAARRNTPAFLREPSLRELYNLLPVTLDPESDLELNKLGHYQLSGMPIEIAAEAFGHPVMQMGDSQAATKQMWHGLAEVYWHFPVLREKPAATVLMRHGGARMGNSYGGHVLLAVQFVGAGRTGYVGLDGTWRWRKYGEELYDRFWVQLVRYLAEGKLLAGTKRGMLATESEQYSLGESVSVSATLFDERFKPLARDEVLGTYQVGAETRPLKLTARRDTPGRFEGRFVPDRTGSYRIGVVVPSVAAGEPIEIVKEIRVSRPNIEILRPRMDRDELRVLSEQSDGGRYFEVDEVSQLAELIPDLHEELPIRSRPTSLWDNWQVMAFLLTLFCVEWFVRKWNRML